MAAAGWIQIAPNSARRRERQAFVQHAEVGGNPKVMHAHMDACTHAHAHAFICVCVLVRTDAHCQNLVLGIWSPEAVGIFNRANLGKDTHWTCAVSKNIFWTLVEMCLAKI